MQDDCLGVSNKPFYKRRKQLIPPPRGASFRTSKIMLMLIIMALIIFYYGGAVITSITVPPYFKILYDALKRQKKLIPLTRGASFRTQKLCSAFSLAGAKVMVAL